MAQGRETELSPLLLFLFPPLFDEDLLLHSYRHLRKQNISCLPGKGSFRLYKGLEELLENSIYGRLYSTISLD